MNISIHIDSTQVRRLIADLPRHLSEAVRGAMTDAVTLVRRDISAYPPQRPGSSYVRTHTLQRSWSQHIEGEGLAIRGIVGSNSNMAPYNREVQDRDMQARIHAVTWRGHTIQDVIEQDERQVLQFFEDRIQAALRR